MAEIIRTWPANDEPKSAAYLFDPRNDHPKSQCYFTLGRGLPKHPIERLWFTYQSRIVGSFRIVEVVMSEGLVERDIRLISDHSEPWAPKRGRWVAVCNRFERAPQRRFMAGFRGWRYFNWQEYSELPESKVRL